MEQKEWTTEGNDLKSDTAYILRLFITGASPNSTRAVENLKIFCETYIKDNYQLEIIDVYQQPAIAEHEQIIALPMLIKKAPGMERRLIGDMSNTEKILQSFNITP